MMPKQIHWEELLYRYNEEAFFLLLQHRCSFPNAPLYALPELLENLLDYFYQDRLHQEYIEAHKEIANALICILENPSLCSIKKVYIYTPEGFSEFLSNFLSDGFPYYPDVFKEIANSHPKTTFSKHWKTYTKIIPDANTYLSNAIEDIKEVLQEYLKFNEEKMFHFYTETLRFPAPVMPQKNKQPIFHR